MRTSMNFVEISVSLKKGNKLLCIKLQSLKFLFINL